jgi:tripartite-type tricarboxylate transporter receptor subunit TctC
VHSKLAFDPQRDFAPLTLAVAFGNVLVVHPSVAARTLAEYLKLASAKPMPYGSSGVAGMGHLAGELMKSLTKTQLEHVPYKGGGPAMADLLGGQIPSMFASSASALPQIKAGKIRAIAVTSPQRSPFMPEVPTVAELGFPGYEAVNWYAFVAPAKTPREIVGKLNQELVAVLKAPDTVTQLAKYGMEPIPSTPEEMAAYVRRENDKWARIVKEAGIRAD